MTRLLLRLDGDTVARLPAHCRGCLFWELGGSCPVDAPAADPATRDAAETRKQAWAAAVAQDGTSAGRAVEVDGALVAHAVFAPAETFAPRPVLPRPDPEVLLLATAWVQPQWRGLGLGRLLLQATLREAHRQERAAVVSYGDRRWLERRCMLPATWLLHEGFEVRIEHPRTPLLAIDVRRTARWAETLEHAVEEVLGHLPRRTRAPSPVPAPAAHPAVDRR